MTAKTQISEIHIDLSAYTMANKFERSVGKSYLTDNFKKIPIIIFLFLESMWAPEGRSILCFSSSSIEYKYIFYLMAYTSNMSEYLEMLKIT